MRSIFFSLALFVFSGLHAQNINPYSQHRLDRFYNLFLEEERDLLEQQGAGGGAYNPNPPEPPPGPDVYYGDYLPITIDNNTITAADDQVYVIVTGQLYNDSSTGVVLSFDPVTGKGSINSFANSTGQASDYAIKLSSLPKNQHGSVVLHVPQIQSARMWISVNQPLQMAMVAPDSLTEPNFKDPSDPNYNILYDFFEFNFQEAASPPVFVNATAVDFFSMPIQCSYSTNTSANSSCGLFQKKSYVFSQLKAAFNATTFDSSEWGKTVLTNNLRVISPGKAAAGNPVLFDTAFYQYGDLCAGDPNYVENVWTGVNCGGLPAGGYYYCNSVPSQTLTIELEDGTTFSGCYSSLTNNLVLNQTNPNVPGNSVVFTNPATTSYTYTLSVSILTQDDTLTTKTGIVTENQRKEVENLFTQGVLAGLAPTTQTLSKANFQNLKNQYFTFNQNLSTSFSASGPVYSIYSKVLTSLGNIYTMSVDEDLFPDVQVSGSFQKGKSYIGITLGSLQ